MEPLAVTVQPDQWGDAGASQTNWSLIYDAAHGPAASARVAWEQLVRRYWPAIYAYLRSRGSDVHEAADTTQGFVCDVLLARRLLEAADPARGRFRTLLLTALKNYIADRHRFDTRRKRAPAAPGGEPARSFTLDAAEVADHSIASSLTPDAAFTAEWSATLVRRVLDRVRVECEGEGLSAHWTVFETRVVRPMLLGEPAASYPYLVDRLGLKDSAQGANMMITVKRRFVRALCEEVGQTVSDPDEIDEELGELLRSLERSHD